jgi:hypothetical protein
MNGFRSWPLVASEYGEMIERRRDAKRGKVLAVLVWDGDVAGEGEIYLHPGFSEIGFVTAKDAMNDWMGLLDHEYSRWHCIFERCNECMGKCKKGTPGVDGPVETEYKCEEEKGE